MKPLTIPMSLVLALAIVSCDQGERNIDETHETADKEAPQVSRHEELANEIMDSLKEFATAVTTVSDLASAHEAAAKISEIGDRFFRIAEKLKTLDPPADELKETINEQMEARDAEMQEVMGEELQKTMQALSPEARQVLQNAFGEFFGKMDAVGTEFERHFSVEGETGS